MPPTLCQLAKACLLVMHTTPGGRHVWAPPSSAYDECVEMGCRLRAGSFGGMFALAGALAGGTHLLSALHGPGCHDCLFRIHTVHLQGVAEIGVLHVWSSSNDQSLH